MITLAADHIAEQALIALSAAQREAWQALQWKAPVIALKVKGTKR